MRDLALAKPPGTDEANLASEGVLASKTVIGAAWLLTWRMFSRSLGFVSTLILARVLVPGDFGIVAMATTFVAAVDTLSQIGVQDALVRHFGDDRKLFDTGFTLQVGRALVTSAIIAGAAPAASLWFHEPRLIPLLLVLAAASLVSGFENIGIVEFSRAMRFDVQFQLNALPRLLQVGVTITAALLLKSYWALLMGIVIAKVARTAMSYWVHPYRPWLKIAGWQELAGFSFWTWAAWIASLVWDRIDPFILGPVIGPARLGLYLLALELAVLPVSEFVEPAAYALFAGFAKAQKQGNSSIQHAPLVTAMLVICIAPFTITISCASGYVVAGLLGPKWAAASPLVAIMAWLCLFSPMSYVCNAVLVANNHVRRNFVGKVIVSAVKLAVLLIAVSYTRRLEFIAAAIVVCVTIEFLRLHAAPEGNGPGPVRSHGRRDRADPAGRLGGGPGPVWDRPRLEKRLPASPASALLRQPDRSAGHRALRRLNPCAVARGRPPSGGRSPAARAGVALRAPVRLVVPEGDLGSPQLVQIRRKSPVRFGPLASLRWSDPDCLGTKRQDRTTRTSAALDQAPVPA